MYLFPGIKVNVEESMKASLLPLQTYFAAKKPSIVLCTGLEAQQEGTNAMNVGRNHPAEAKYSIWELKMMWIHHVMILHQLVLKMVESLEAQEGTQCNE